MVMKMNKKDLAVVLSKETGVSLEMARSVVEIIEEIGSPFSVDEGVVREVAARCDVDEEEAQRLVESFKKIVGKELARKITHPFDR